MKYRVLVRQRAKADVRSGLGREFVGEMDAALSRVADNPLQYQVLHRDARRAIVRRFPYGIFFRVEGDKIIVFSVIHLHRDPVVWKGRIPKA